MGDVTWFVALPFTDSEDGPVPGEAEECQSANIAIMRAEALLRKEGNIGALAFSRSGDLSEGRFDEAKVIRSFGQMPDDLTML
ncbi:MAG: hypothetical protein J0G33_10785 [Afipia felis]|nr:hypothetical protein [Afipia felis]